MEMNEENYIKCLIDDDDVEMGIPVAPVPVTQPNPLTVQNFPIAGAENLLNQTHQCDSCPYSSQYKGNVIRHMKLVHSQGATSSMKSTSPSLEAEDLAMPVSSNNHNLDSPKSTESKR